MRKLFLMLIGFVALAGMFFSPMSDTFAKAFTGECETLNVMSIGPTTDSACQEIIDITAYTPDQDVHLVRAQRFAPNTTLHVYVVALGSSGASYELCQPIGPNLAVVTGVNDSPNPLAPFGTRLGDPFIFTTDASGNVDCGTGGSINSTIIWGDPLTNANMVRSDGGPLFGGYRIVGDQVGWYDFDGDGVKEQYVGEPDGIYNSGDSVCFQGPEACFSIVDVTNPVYVADVNAAGKGGNYDVTVIVENCGNAPANVTVRMETLNAAGAVVDGPFDLPLTVNPIDPDVDGCMQGTVLFNGPIGAGVPATGAQTRASIVGSVSPPFVTPLDAEGGGAVEP